MNEFTEQEYFYEDLEDFEWEDLDIEAIVEELKIKYCDIIINQDKE